MSKYKCTLSNDRFRAEYMIDMERERIQRTYLNWFGFNPIEEPGLSIGETLVATVQCVDENKTSEADTEVAQEHWVLLRGNYAQIDVLLHRYIPCDDVTNLIPVQNDLGDRWDPNEVMYATYTSKGTTDVKTRKKPLWRVLSNLHQTIAADILKVPRDQVKFLHGHYG